MSFLSKLFGGGEKTKVTPKKEIVTLSDEEKNKLKTNISELNEKLVSVETTDEKADILNELGALNQKLGESDEAIRNYEESLKIKETFGPAFDGLTKLYNEKRKEAAYNKDDEKIQYWVKKTDDLLAQSKKIMRSR